MSAVRRDDVQAVIEEADVETAVGREGERGDVAVGEGGGRGWQSAGPAAFRTTNEGAVGYGEERAGSVEEGVDALGRGGLGDVARGGDGGAAQVWGGVERDELDALVERADGETVGGGVVREGVCEDAGSEDSRGSEGLGGEVELGDAERGSGVGFLADDVLGHDQ